MFSVPFDDNYVFLTSDVFASYEVRYFNASKIVFNGCWMKTQNSNEQVFVPGCPQRFIACSAPKPASFRHFWHMVIQEKVGPIMIGY